MTEFKTNCTDGESHIPVDNTSLSTCKKCGKQIWETNEGSGFWFTDEDDRNWDNMYNEVSNQ